MRELLKPRSIVVVLGSGGVGKTTVAAALGVAAAASGRNTAVVTVDPAQRLRDALGLARLCGKPIRVDARRLRDAGLDPALRLSAMMLDVHGEWDAMVARHVANPALRGRILENVFYQELRDRFAGSDAYAALEALYNLHDTRQFDLEIVDTPPAAHAFDFLEAPARLARLLDSSATRWLLQPSLSSAPFAVRLMGRAARYAARELGRFAGDNTLSSIAEFFAAAADAAGRMALRMRKMESLLRSPAVRFVLVTTAEQERLRQARELIAQMDGAGLRLEAIVINRFVDETILSCSANAPDGAVRILSEVSSLRTALGVDGVRDDGEGAALAYLEQYRDRAREAFGRVMRFADQMPARLKIALTPEIRPGTPALTALGRLAPFLTAGPALAGRRGRGARADARNDHASTKLEQRLERSDAGVSL